MTTTSAVEPAVVLSLTQIHKRLGNASIVRGVSLCLRQGERVAVIGPNGAGKTTLFNLVSGLLAPDTGEIVLQTPGTCAKRIDGLPPEQVHRLGLSRSFQISRVLKGLSVFDNLRCAALWSENTGYAFWRRLSQCHRANERAQHMLEQLGLASMANRAAGELSYANQRALELGLATVGGSPVVLLDEPTAGMSHAETAHCIDLIRRLTEGKTLLMVEHDMGVVFDLADRVAVLVDGELIAFDTAERVRADARVQAAYLGVLAPLQAVSA
ncbi:MAG: ABC transporter ATP-binding protein [Burkholderiaceae bacterium]|jgi:branched-chain amino acid transport system ATP-binding protein